MSSFLVCDNVDCPNNESNSLIFSVDRDASKILIENGYEYESYICLTCLISIAKDDDVNRLIGIDYAEDVIAIDDDPGTSTLDEYEVVLTEYATRE